MAAKEFLGGDSIASQGAALGITRSKEHIRERHEQDVMMNRSTLCGCRASEKGGQEGV